MNELEDSNGMSALWIVAAGAVAGAVAGYVLRTPRGRRALDDVVVMLDDFASGCAQLSQACARARVAASDSWDAVSGVLTLKSKNIR